MATEENLEIRFTGILQWGNAGLPLSVDDTHQEALYDYSVLRCSSLSAVTSPHAMYKWLSQADFQ